MQSLSNLSRSVVHVIFRGGSAQRIHFDARRMVIATLVLVALIIAVQLLGYRNDPIETGLFLFSLLSGFYIGAALATRRAPRPRLQVSLFGSVLTGCVAHLPLLALMIVPQPPQWLLVGLTLLALGIAIAGVSGCVRHALGGSRARALSYTVAFFAGVGAFYGTMFALIQVVFG